jgi:hypothetical protein
VHDNLQVQGWSGEVQLNHLNDEGQIVAAPSLKNNF